MSFNCTPKYPTGFTKKKRKRNELGWILLAGEAAEAANETIGDGTGCSAAGGGVEGATGLGLWLCAGRIRLW